MGILLGSRYHSNHIIVQVYVFLPCPKVDNGKLSHSLDDWPFHDSAGINILERDFLLSIPDIESW